MTPSITFGEPKIEGYFWVIGGGVLQVPVVEEAKRIGLRVIVSDGNPNCQCSELADVFWPVDIFDIDEHLRKADIALSNGMKINRYFEEISIDLRIRKLFQDRNQRYKFSHYSMHKHFL